MHAELPCKSKFVFGRGEFFLHCVNHGVYSRRLTHPPPGNGVNGASFDEIDPEARRRRVSSRGDICPVSLSTRDSAILSRAANQSPADKEIELSPGRGNLRDRSLYIRVQLCAIHISAAGFSRAGGILLSSVAQRTYAVEFFAVSHCIGRSTNDSVVELNWQEMSP